MASTVHLPSSSQLSISCAMVVSRLFCLVVVVCLVETVGVSLKFYLSSLEKYVVGM